MNSKRMTLLPSGATIAVVAIGPLLSVLLVVNSLAPHLGGGELPLALFAVLLFWSPFFFSIPAFLMQDGRDQLLPEMNGGGSVLRAFLLIPAMLQKASGIQREAIASLVGLGLGVLVALPFMTGLSSIIF